MSFANACVDGGDCDDNNADVNPGMEEICGDGIDNNCDGNVDENCYPFTCGADLDFSNLDFTYSGYGSDCFSDFGCAVYPYSFVDFQWNDSEGNYYYYSVTAFDLRNYTCVEYYDDYFISVYFDTYNSETNEYEYCQETWGNNSTWAEDYNMGTGTVELYDEAVGFINNLAADLEIEDQCANGARTSGADSVKNMESMPDELKKILEERKAMLPPTR